MTAALDTRTVAWLGPVLAAFDAALGRGFTRMVVAPLPPKSRRGAALAGLARVVAL